jgi:hypothetical protein
VLQLRESHLFCAINTLSNELKNSVPLKTERFTFFDSQSLRMQTNDWKKGELVLCDSFCHNQIFARMQKGEDGESWYCYNGAGYGALPAMAF